MNVTDLQLLVNTESLYCKRGRERIQVFHCTEKKTALLIHSFKPLIWTQAHLIHFAWTHKPSRKQNKTEKQTHGVFGFFSIALSFTKYHLSL